MLVPHVVKTPSTASVFLLGKKIHPTKKRLSYRRQETVMPVLYIVKPASGGLQCLCLLLTKPRSDFEVTQCVTQSITLCWQSNQFHFSTT
jgi:hypothetical protein